VLQPSAFRFGEYALSDWLSLAYLGGIQVGLAYICFYAALKRISTTQAAILTLLEPVLNPVWVFLAVGELPSSYGFAGAGLIISGVLVDAWLRRPRRGPVPARPPRSGEKG
jgi:drug/metabolite transporter (DMT)-like permease